MNQSTRTNIEYIHASKFGNGAKIAEQFQRQMANKGVAVAVRHIRDARPDELEPADLYVFSSPGRIGKPTGSMRRFLKNVSLPAGTKYALLTTEMAQRSNKKVRRRSTEEPAPEWQRVIPIMNEILQDKGLVNVADGKVLVNGLKGPLEVGWQTKVETFADKLATISTS